MLVVYKLRSRLLYHILKISFLILTNVTIVPLVFLQNVVQVKLQMRQCV